jgi:hypothetical protein
MISRYCHFKCGPESRKEKHVCPQPWQVLSKLDLVSLARVGATCTRLYQLAQAGSEKTRFKRKPSPVVFWVFWFFVGFFYICEFLGFFQFQKHF